MCAMCCNSINYLAVALAALSYIVVSSIWHSPKVFGDKWAKLSGFKSMKNFNPGWWSFVGMIITSLMMSLGIALIMSCCHCVGGRMGLLTGLTVSVLFMVTTKANIWMFHKKFTLFVLESAHLMLTCAIMGVIIGKMG